MKNKQRGFLVPLFIILAAAAIGLGVYVSIKNKTAPTIVTFSNPTPSLVKRTIEANASTSTPSGWEIYTNTKYGYSIAYPANAKVVSYEENGDPFLGTPLARISATGDDLTISINSSYPDIKDAAVYICPGSCGPTGVGTHRPVTPSLILNGRVYSAGGQKYATNEFVAATPEDKLQIGYFIDGDYVNASSTISDQEYASLETQLQAIIQTFYLKNVMALPPLWSSDGGLSNAPITFGPNETWVKLNNGIYTDPSGKGSIALEAMTETEGDLISNGAPIIMYGDLNGDGNDDAVAIADTKYEGEVSKKLAVWINENGDPAYVAEAELGKNPIIVSTSIDKGVISVDMIPDESNTDVVKYGQRTTWTFAFQNGSLVKTSVTPNNAPALTSSAVSVVTNTIPEQYKITLYGSGLTKTLGVSYQGAGYNTTVLVSGDLMISADGTSLSFMVPLRSSDSVDPVEVSAEMAQPGNIAVYVEYEAPSYDASNELNVTLPPVSLSAPVAEGWQVYTNSQYGFQIQYPAGTQIDDGGVARDSEDYISFSLPTASSSPANSEDIFYIEIGPASCDDFSLPGYSVTTSRITINGIDFTEGDTSASTAAASMRGSSTEYCVQEGQTSYKLSPTIIYGYDEATSDGVNPAINVNNDPVLNQMVSSFKFTR